MKNFRPLHVGMLASVLTLTGCASIVSKSDWPVTFKSNPSGADISITDKDGNEVHRGTTPATITLPSSSGYFSSATYHVDIRLNGYQEGKGVVPAKLNGWYVGNIVFGGLIGFLIVDPATGAMWKLPPQYTVNLSKVESSSSASQIIIQSKIDATGSNAATAESITNSVPQK